MAKNVIRWTLLGFVALCVVMLVGKQIAARRGGETLPSIDATGRKVIVYYFHAHVRCANCEKIERYSREATELAVAQRWPKLLEWQKVNYETSDNERYAVALQLVAPSVVLVEYRDGQPAAHRLLERTWELVDDPPAFAAYMRESLDGFVGRVPTTDNNTR